MKDRVSEESVRVCAYHRLNVEVKKKAPHWSDAKEPREFRFEAL